MTLSTKQKIILQDPRSGQYLAMVPTQENGIAFAIWTPLEAEALPMSMPEVLTLSEGWSYLDSCITLPVAKVAQGE